MRIYVVAGLLAVLIAGGCSSGTSSPMNNEEFTAVRELSGDTLMMVGPDASMGRWAVVKKAASSKEFADKVAKFESATVPASIPDGAALKEKTVKALQNFIAAAKASDNASLEAAWKELHAAIGNLNAAVEGRKAG